MQNLLFLMRVSFICNVCLFLSWLTKFFPILPGGFISSTVIVLGIGVSFFLNLLINIVVAIMLVRKRSSIRFFPRWLIIVNFLFLIPQLILLLK